MDCLLFEIVESLGLVGFATLKLDSQPLFCASEEIIND